MDTLRLASEREAALAHARRDAATLVASLALHAESTFKIGEALLAGLVEHLDGEGWSSGRMPRLSGVLVGGHPTLDWINNVGFYDAAGLRILGPDGMDQGYHVEDRAYFVEHRANPDRGTHIAAPIVSRSTGKWVIPLTRRVNNADGSFAGVAVVSLDVERLLGGYESLGLARTGALAMFMADGTLLLRHPFVAASLGKNYSTQAIFAAVRSGLDAGDVEQVTPIDGVRRLLSFHRLLDGQLVLSVGIERAEALATWWQMTLWHLAGLASLLTVVLILARILRRMERQGRAAELSAARRETKRRVLARHTLDIVLEFDAEFRCRHAGAVLRDVSGYDPAALAGTRMLDALRPADGNEVSRLFAAAWRGDSDARATLCLHRPDGSPIWMETVLWRFAEEGAGPLAPGAILGVMHDVTARRMAQAREAAALANLRVTHAALLRAEAIAHVGHWRLSTRDASLTCSEEARRIHGWSPSAAPALTLDDMLARVHPQDRELTGLAIRRAMRDGEAFKVEYRLSQPDGTIRFVCCLAEPEHDAGGELVEIIGTAQDVTERVALERELLHEQKMKTIGQLAAGVAHDFNNVLQGITGCLELIGDALGETTPARRYVGIALAAAERGSSLTRHLLSCARKQVLKPKPLPAQEILRSIRELLERTLGPRVAVVADIADALPPIAADPAHLRIALLNLGVNAGDAMPDGGTLTLRAALRPASARDRDATTHPVVVISVEDTGVGMDAATLSQAAEPFFTTKGVEGSGLGLSMVKGFAEQSGGEMRATSEPGRGTRIELHMPAIRREPIAVAIQPAVSGSVRAFHALLVDDAPDVLTTTAAFLAGDLARVVTAASGGEALQHLRRDPGIDVLITDYAMPGLNGVETIRAARAMRPDLAAVIISGYADAVDVADPPEDAQILRKPFQRRDLLEAVRRAIASRAEEARVPMAAI